MDKNQTFSHMAGQVDNALEDLHDARKDAEDRKMDLDKAGIRLRAAQSAFEKARDALYEAHPEMLPREGNEDKRPVGEGFE